MRIKFQKSIARLSFLCCITDINIAWINPYITIFLFTKGLLEYVVLQKVIGEDFKVERERNNMTRVKRRKYITGK